MNQERLPTVVLPRINDTLTHAQFKSQASDFQVRERLTVDDEGEGEHQWLWVKKEGANTRFVAEQLAKFAGVHPRQVSYSGMKDRNAVTWQWFSVQLPGQDMLPWQQLALEGVVIERAIRRTKKLKLGFHKANEFTIRLRAVEDKKRFIDNWQRLCQQGTINYFGSQRFGHDGQNVVQARRWIRAERPHKISKAKRSLWLSAMRSYLFNHVAAERFKKHGFNPLAGDCVMLNGSQSVFVAEQWDYSLQQRLQEHDILLTAPMPGEDGCGLVDDVAKAFEQECLAPFQPWLEDFSKVRLKASRRAFALFMQTPELHWEGDDAIVSFALPTGCFATTCINELIDLSVTDNDEHSVE